ncbi:MAG TPA: NTP transferase domain-containing protein [Saprospiraceae bacterium]|nr:NTP transferase domain-containing protein [Saprospiraceae bacterium]
MKVKKHVKHTELLKPMGGKFHQNEWSFLGAPCGWLKDFVHLTAKNLTGYRWAYIDANHHPSERGLSYEISVTDQIGWHRIETQSDHIDWDYRSIFNSASAVLVNGNHFEAEKQWVIIHPEKKDSLRRKLNRLTQVVGFILAENENVVYDFLYEYNPEWRKLPVYTAHAREHFYKALGDRIKANLPQLNGLILAGGKSKRMGMDKTQIRYHHNKTHIDFTAELLQNVCKNVWLSVTDGTASSSEFPVIEDLFKDLGPLGGILSAFRYNPHSAWMTLATDLPLLNAGIIQELIENRNPEKFATSFYNPATGFPEPLFTIWEPRAYQRILYFMSLGYACPRKVLINSDIHMIETSQHEALQNVNTPEERDKILNILRNS